MIDENSNSDAVRKTSRSLPIALLRSRETLMVPIRGMLNEIGLTEQKWRILRTLDERGRIEQSTIANEACLLLPSVTRITRSMEMAGLLTRISDREDKRRVMVEITEKGERLIRDNIQVSNEIFSRLEIQMGRKKVNQLLDLLDELQDVSL